MRKWRKEKALGNMKTHSYFPFHPLSSPYPVPADLPEVQGWVGPCIVAAFSPPSNPMPAYATTQQPLIRPLRLSCLVSRLAVPNVRLRFVTRLIAINSHSRILCDGFSTKKRPPFAGHTAHLRFDFGDLYLEALILTVCIRRCGIMH